MCTLFYFVDLRTRFGMRDHIGNKDQTIKTTSRNSYTLQ